MTLYGGKCHLCAHLDGPTHRVPATWPVADDECPECSFCQEASFYGMLLRSLGGERMFSPLSREALDCFRRGKPHPVIDQLRAEIAELHNDGTGAEKERTQ